jgi:hypothetical protein
MNCPTAAGAYFWPRPQRGPRRPHWQSWSASQHVGEFGGAHLLGPVRSGGHSPISSAAATSPRSASHVFPVHVVVAGTARAIEAAEQGRGRRAVMAARWCSPENRTIPLHPLIRSQSTAPARPSWVGQSVGGLQLGALPMATPRPAADRRRRSHRPHRNRFADPPAGQSLIRPLGHPRGHSHISRCTGAAQHG